MGDITINGCCVYCGRRVQTTGGCPCYWSQPMRQRDGYTLTLQSDTSRPLDRRVEALEDEVKELKEEVSRLRGRLQMRGY